MTTLLEQLEQARATLARLERAALIKRGLLDSACRLTERGREIAAMLK